MNATYPPTACALSLRHCRNQPAAYISGDDEDKGVCDDHASAAQRAGYVLRAIPRT